MAIDTGLMAKAQKYYMKKMELFGNKVDRSHPRFSTVWGTAKNIKASIWNKPDDNSDNIILGNLRIISDEVKVKEIKEILQ